MTSTITENYFDP